MSKTQRKLITIVTESVLEAELCDVLTDIGVSGYTVTNARGSGSRGIRDAGWSSSGNVRIEVICGEKIAAAVEKKLHADYYDHYAMILFESDVKVLRDDKFD